MARRVSSKKGIFKYSLKDVEEWIKGSTLSLCDESEYKGWEHGKIILECSIHGKDEYNCERLVNGSFCKKCIREKPNKLMSNDEFIKNCRKIHNNFYEYSKTKYENSKSIITITCPKHGDFQQEARVHRSGSGCPGCKKRGVSKPETAWLDYHNVPQQYRQHKIRMNGKSYRVDGYDPVRNLVYEFNGNYWHGHPELYDPNEINKMTKTTFGELYRKTKEKELLLVEHGYNILSTWEHDNKIYPDWVDKDEFDPKKIIEEIKRKYDNK